MKDLLEHIVKSIVKHPNQVEITEENPENSLFVLKINVDKEDMGLIIGKEGRVIKAIRNIIRLKAFKEGKKVKVELIEKMPDDNAPMSNEPEGSNDKNI